MNNLTPIIDTEWIHFLCTGESESFLGRVGNTREEYGALLLDILPEKSQSDLERDQQDFLQVQGKTQLGHRLEEVLNFAQWHMYGEYEQIFGYRLSGDDFTLGLVQNAWNTLSEALSLLSDEEKTVAIAHCRSMGISVEEECPDVDYYCGAKSFFEDFDFYAGITSMSSRYDPKKPLTKC